MLTASERQQRASIAARRRHHGSDPETDRLAREFRAERLAAHIRRTVDAAPPLTSEQRERLAMLLRPSAQSGDAA